MKILIVSASDLHGGAARASYRLHQALLHENIDSQMLVQNKMSDDFSIVGPHSKFRKAIHQLKPALDILPFMFYKHKTPTYYSASWLPTYYLLNKINELKPDIVHLHWVNGGMIRLSELKRIKVPIIWSLHDDWVFTGGCHVKWGCEKYQKKCGECPMLGSKMEFDLSRWIWSRKRKAFSQIKDLTIVPLSRWQEQCSQNSSLLRNRKHVQLSNPLNINVFRPFNKREARNIWRLPSEKRLILFGAINAMSNVNKGFRELCLALKNIHREDIEFVVFGASRPVNVPNFGCQTHYVGSLSDDVSLVSLYSAVDVMVVPSRQEAFGQTASEAMACGTPVVAFKHTGLLDIIDHKINGYLAKPFDTKELAYGIEWILDNENYEGLGINAREKIINQFDSVKVAKQYIDLYKQVLDKKDE